MARKTIYVYTVEEAVRDGALITLSSFGDYRITMTPAAREIVTDEEIQAIEDSRPRIKTVREVKKGVMCECCQQPFFDGPKKSLAFYIKGER